MKLCFAILYFAVFIQSGFGLGLNNPAFLGVSKASLLTIAPVNTVRPSVDNNAPGDVGITLTATPGTYTGSPTSYVRQWKRNGTNIVGETNLTYVTATADRGLGLSFYEKAVNAAGNSGDVRATTGLPRPFFISGDSLWTIEAITTNLQAVLGATWLVNNVAHSGDDIALMEGVATNLVDPFIQIGWGVSFYHEYANTVSGIQGSVDGTNCFQQHETFGKRRQTNGAVVITSTTFYRSNGVLDGTQAHIASEFTRANYATHSVGFVDLDDASFLASADSFDGVHWVVGPGYATLTNIVNLIVAKISALGLQGDGGEIPVPNAPATENLRTHTVNTYVYDPVNPLPNPYPFPGNNYLHVVSGTGWTVGSYLIVGLLDSFPTADGNQRLYNLTSAPGAASLSGGVYFISDSP